MSPDRQVQHPDIGCLDCRLPYELFPLDVILPRPQWLDIHPDENGLLCAACIVKRASRVPGVTCVRAILEIAPHRATAEAVCERPAPTHRTESAAQTSAPEPSSLSAAVVDPSGGGTVYASELAAVVSQAQVQTAIDTKLRCWKCGTAAYQPNERCDSHVSWEDRLHTEMTLKAAWEKRAYEAEAVVSSGWPPQTHKKEEQKSEEV